MENYIINQGYFAPIWIVDAIYFGSRAYKNFKEMRNNDTKLLPALFWSTASACAVGMTGMCLENMLK